MIFLAVWIKFSSEKWSELVVTPILKPCYKSGEQVLPARELEGYWLYWAVFPGKRAVAMLGCCHAAVLRHNGVGIGFGTSWARALVTISPKPGVYGLLFTWLK